MWFPVACYYSAQVSAPKSRVTFRALLTAPLAKGWTLPAHLLRLCRRAVEDEGPHVKPNLARLMKRVSCARDMRKEREAKEKVKGEEMAQGLELKGRFSACTGRWFEGGALCPLFHLGSRRWHTLRLPVSPAVPCRHHYLPPTLP